MITSVLISNRKDFIYLKILFQHICPTYSTHYTYVNYFLCKFFAGLGIWPGKVLPKYFYLKECKLHVITHLSYWWQEGLHWWTPLGTRSLIILSPEGLTASCVTGRKTSLMMWILNPINHHPKQRVTIMKLHTSFYTLTSSLLGPNIFVGTCSQMHSLYGHTWRCFYFLYLRLVCGYVCACMCIFNLNFWMSQLSSMKCGAATECHPTTML